MRDEISVTLRAITFPTFPIFFSGHFSLHLLRDHTFPTAVVKADWHVRTRPAKTVTYIQIRPRINAGIVHLLQLHVQVLCCDIAVHAKGLVGLGTCFWQLGCQWTPADPLNMQVCPTLGQLVYIFSHKS